jgi:hypothetical protein
MRKLITRKSAPADCLTPNFAPQKQSGGQPVVTRRKRLKKRNYSNFSVINGNCSLAFASDFTTKPSADSEVVFRAVAISLTNNYSLCLLIM